MDTLLYWLIFYSFIAAVMCIPHRFVFAAYGIYGALLWTLILAWVLYSWAKLLYSLLWAK